MRDRLRKMSIVLAVGAFLAVSSAAVLSAGGPESSAPTYLYKTTFVRAAPGRLLDLIALYKNRVAVEEAAGDERPFWWRHTQGDQWDLMLLFPMGSYSEYYAKERLAQRRKAEAAAPLPAAEFKRQLDACSAWREDLFVLGPPLETVKKAFEGTAYYHVEICVALPGRQEELYKERVMENVYQTALGRPEYMIFVRDQGATWDLFTLAGFRDLMHWASSGEATREEREAAARKAGFSDPDAIGPYLRTLIQMHRDTMGVAIK